MTGTEGEWTKDEVWRERGGGAGPHRRQRRGKASAAKTSRTRAAWPETPCFL